MVRKKTGQKRSKSANAPENLFQPCLEKLCNFIYFFQDNHKNLFCKESIICQFTFTSKRRQKLHIKLEIVFFKTLDKQNKDKLVGVYNIIYFNNIIDLVSIDSLSKDFFNFRDVVPSYVSEITFSGDRMNASTTNKNSFFFCNVNKKKTENITKSPISWLKTWKSRPFLKNC